MRFEQRYVDVVNDVVSSIGDFDLVVDDAARGGPPSAYLRSHRYEYIRTTQDVARHFAGRRGVRLLEIGSFFGVVSIALAELGFDVTASDIPEYMTMLEQQTRFARHNVDTACVRLEDFVLPFADSSFDAVVMCEVLEHLNFNPLPLFKEINRVMVDGGLYYLSLPNQASIYNRLSLLRGRSIQVPVRSFFAQLDPADPEIANAHWREYTTKDVRCMLSPLGFRIDRQYYFSLGECQRATTPRKWLARAFYRAFPSLKENQTTLAIKTHRTTIEFSIPSTVHPKLRTL